MFDLEVNGKLCIRCNEILDIEKFTKNKRMKDGREIYCKQCKNSLKRKYKKSEKVKLSNRKYALKLKYRITIEQYDNMLQNQNGKCYICETIDPSNNGIKNNVKYFCVDHDKITNKVRGLLCYKCNLALGYFDHNVKRLANSIKYLKNHA